MGIPRKHFQETNMQQLEVVVQKWERKKLISHAVCRLANHLRA